MSTRTPQDPKAPQATWLNRSDMMFPTDLCATIHEIVALQDKYAHVKTFVPVAPPALELATMDAKKTVQKIQKAMEASILNLTALHKQLEQKVKNVEDQTFKIEGWYKSALVLGPLFQERHEFWLRLQQIRDPSAYASSLSTQIAKKSSTIEHPARENLRPFMNACCEEIARVQSMSRGPPHALKLWIQFKTELVLPHMGLKESGPHPKIGPNPKIDAAILGLVDAPVDHSSPLDFAAAARVLNRTMAMDVLCSAAPPFYTCIHDPSYLLLDRLFKRAYIDIRVNTLRATGRRFPQELVDLIFQHTLAAEGIPSDPRVLVPRLGSEAQLSRPHLQAGHSVSSPSSNPSLSFSPRTKAVDHHPTRAKGEAPLMVPQHSYFCPHSYYCMAGLRVPQRSSSRFGIRTNQAPDENHMPNGIRQVRLSVRRSSPSSDRAPV